MSTRHPDRPASALDRRQFLAAAAGTAAAAGSAGGAVAGASAGTASRTSFARRPANGPVAVASGNGVNAVARAREQMLAGASPTVAVVEGVTLVEDDPDDTTVGYGGLPNEDGVVQLDASVMDGPMHKAGAVAAMERIRNPAKVALKVLEETDHVLIVGDGARRFAVGHGFREENLLTERAREAWLRWKANLSTQDDWLGGEQRIRLRRAGEADGAAATPRDPRPVGEIPFTYGTINCCGLDANGDLGAVTTTSGLSWKIPGRVGDSPIVGAGMYVDNEVGAAGATGRGESLIQSCGAFQIVRHMADGDEPQEACLKVLKWIADHTKRPDLLDERGRPNFNAVVYALRKDGKFGAACMRGDIERGAAFAVCDADGARRERSVPLFEVRRGR